MNEYEAYKLRWMLEHGYSLNDLIQSLSELQYSDPEDSDQISTPISELFAQWERDIGFGSEVWACKSEWAETESKWPEIEIQPQLSDTIQIKNLAEVENTDKALFYWCNCVGEINIPETDPLSMHDVDELPPKVAELYEKYQSESYLCNTYILNYYGKPAIGLWWCFGDHDWLEENILKHPPTRVDMDMCFNVLSQYANQLKSDMLHVGISNVDILLGKDTLGEDGHELMIVIPYERTELFDQILKGLDNGNRVYTWVDAMLKEAFSPLEKA